MQAERQALLLLLLLAYSKMSTTVLSATAYRQPTVVLAKDNSNGAVPGLQLA
jgi:hypothetical protein